MGSPSVGARRTFFGLQGCDLPALKGNVRQSRGGPWAAPSCGASGGWG